MPRSLPAKFIRIFWALFVRAASVLFRTHGYRAYWGLKPLEADFDWRADMEKPYRRWLAREIFYSDSPGSVFEFGCGAGQNLAPFSTLGDLRLVGVDLNRARISMARRSFRELGVRAEFHVGGDDFSGFGKDEFGVSLTCATLMYIGDDRILRVISELMRIASGGLWAVEFHDGSLPDWRSRHCRDGFVRNYYLLSKEAGFEAEVRKLPEGMFPAAGRWPAFARIVRIRKS